MTLEVTVLVQRSGEEEPGLANESLVSLVTDALRAAATVTNYKGENNEVNVLITDDDGISDYHEAYLGDPSPTDVITFSAGPPSEEPAVLGGPRSYVLGDIVVSEDTAASQAAQYGHSPDRELALYVIHGFLHLVGYDDCDETSRLRMREMEQKALLLL